MESLCQCAYCLLPILIVSVFFEYLGVTPPLSPENSCLGSFIIYVCPGMEQSFHLKMPPSEKLTVVFSGGVEYPEAFANHSSSSIIAPIRSTVKQATFCFHRSLAPFHRRYLSPRGIPSVPYPHGPVTNEDTSWWWVLIANAFRAIKSQSSFSKCYAWQLVCIHFWWQEVESETTELYRHTAGNAWRFSFAPHLWVVTCFSHALATPFSEKHYFTRWFTLKGATLIPIRLPRMFWNILLPFGP